LNVKFDVTCELDYQCLGQTEFFFNIHAANSEHQRVTRESLYVGGAHYMTEHLQPETGNRFLRASAPAGDVRLRYAARIDIDYFDSPPEALAEIPVAQLPIEVLPYVLPSRYCQSDKLIEFALKEFGAIPPGFARVQAVSDWVNRHISFVPGTTSAHTCALDVLVQRKGVCRDFAHLTIALLRALNIPARFVTGYDYGVPAVYGPTDFHAYVEAFLGQRWYIFDATQLCPRNGLVRIGTGRDAADAAFATIFGPAQMQSMRLSIEPLFAADSVCEIVDDRNIALSTAGLDNGACWKQPPEAQVLQ
jgi:transglutaminase-like putative cysteine protease